MLSKIKQHYTPKPEKDRVCDGATHYTPLGIIYS